jgi:hypothetical protein
VHPAQELIDQYALNGLPNDLLEESEKHLLVCPSCQEAVEQTDQLIAALRVAKVQEPKVIDIDALRAFRARSATGMSGDAAC